MHRERGRQIECAEKVEQAASPAWSFAAADKEYKMSRIRKAAIHLCLVLLSGALAGCYRAPDTTWYTPHVYKGAEDPLRSKLQDGAVHQALEARFQSVQTDR